MTTNEDFLDALDSDRSREIVKALDDYKAAHGINQELTAGEIVDAARDPESVLHHFFDWDDESAAKKHRLDTARKLIASVRYIIREEGRVTFRAFTSVKPTKADDRRYERISRVMDDETLQQARLADFQRRLAGLLSEFADIGDQHLKPVRKLRDGLTKLLKPLSTAA